MPTTLVDCSWILQCSWIQSTLDPRRKERPFRTVFPLLLFSLVHILLQSLLGSGKCSLNFRRCHVKINVTITEYQINALGPISRSHIVVLLGFLSLMTMLLIEGKAQRKGSRIIWTVELTWQDIGYWLVSIFLLFQIPRSKYTSLLVWHISAHFNTFLSHTSQL